MKKVRIIDSHTGGEPTRVVIEGAPDLGEGSLDERRDVFRRNHNAFRAAVINEPRGNDVLIGALLEKPHSDQCDHGVIFFNNIGPLNMCGHGTIGLLATLRHLGRVEIGSHLIETPVGIVKTTLHNDNEVSVRNVPSYRAKGKVKVKVPDFGTVHGDIAWGGNWFFLVETPDLEFSLKNVDELTAISWRIRRALESNKITSPTGAEIDHIELFGPPAHLDAHSKNFILCPGGAYDRSPCGTGTSAKLACLHADGKLQPGEIWRQESITGSIFEGSVEIEHTQVIPTIKGSAFITGEGTLLLDENDPFCWGIPT